MNGMYLEWDDAAFLLSRLPEHGGSRVEQRVRARLVCMMRECDGDTVGHGFPAIPSADIRSRAAYWRDRAPLSVMSHQKLKLR